MLELKRATLKDFNRLYPFYFEDFPYGERKSYKRMKRFIQNGVFQFWVMEEDGKWVGYLSAMVLPNHSFILLDYLAIKKEKRNQGYGEKMISLLKKEYHSYHGFVGEVDAVACAPTKEEAETRARRIKFYERLGFIVYSNILISMYDVDYNLAYGPIQKTVLDEEKIILGLQYIYYHVYENMYHDIDHVKKYIRFNYN